MFDQTPITILFIGEEGGAPCPAACLRQAGFRVRRARAAAEALALAAAEAPRLVVVRGQPAGATAAELCARLKALPAAAPVLRLVGHAGEAEGAEEVDAYLIGPVGPRALLAQVRTLLRVGAAEAALGDSEALYHSLVETLPVCIFRKDLRGRFTFANRPFCAELRRPLAEIVGRTDFDFFPAELARKYIGDDRRVLETGAPFEDVEEHTTGDGHTAYVEVLKAPVRDGGGRVVGLQGVFWDVTARRRAEEEVARTTAEFEVARQVQQRLFPAAVPRLGGAGGVAFDVGGASFPAEAVGGDYFDYLALPDGSLGVAIGDVTGHGVGPALLMAVARAYLRACAAASADVGAILAGVNRLLATDVEGDRYLTLLLARLDPATGTLGYASAGHATAYVLDGAGAVKVLLESTGVPLGIHPASEFPAGPEVRLQPGDVVLLLTDGVVEARDPEGNLFGPDRALDVVRAHRQAPAREVVDHLYRAVRAFARHQPQLDDVTATVIKVGEGAVSDPI